MNNLEKTLLQLLVTIEDVKEYNIELANLLSQTAIMLFNSEIPVVKLAVKNLDNKNFITKEGTPTFEGKLQTVTDISRYGNVHLSLQTKFHIQECLRRELFHTHVVDGKIRKGVLAFLNDKSLQQMVEYSLGECFERVQNGAQASTFLTGDTAEYILDLDEKLHQELQVTTASNEVVVNDTVTEVENVPKPKVAKKATKRVKV